MSDPAVTARFLRRYFGDLEEDECFELRYIRRDPRKVQERFLRDTTAAAAQAHGASDAGFDCYFGAAARQRGKHDGSAEGVVRSRWLWADLDFKDFAGDPEAAKQAIRDLNLWPQILVQSGGGLHAYWQLSTPINDPDELKDWLTRLHLALPGSDGKVADAARVMRLPGSVNLKEGYGAPLVTASYFEQFQPYAPEALDALLPEAPTETRVSSTYDGPPGELDQLAEALTFINPDQPFLDYDDWTHVLMGIHDAFPGPEGLALAESWGRGYRGEIAGKWRTFKEGKYTVATVFYKAQQNGYVRPRLMPGPVITSGPAGASAVRPTPRPGHGVVWLPEFLAAEPPPLEWCVEGLLPRGGTSLLVSPPKLGKSFWAINAGLSVASGTPFLGRATTQGRAILFSLDMPKDPLWFPIAKLAPAYGSPEGWGFLARGNDELLAANPFERIAEIIRAEKPALAIIDTLQKALRIAETNNYAEVVTAMDRISSLAEETGTHIMAIHHSNKGDGSGMNRILGSIGFNGAVDTMLMLQADPEIAAYSLEIESRWTAPQPKAAFGVDDHDRRVFLIDDSRERAALRACGSQILGYLATCDGDVTEKDLRAALLHPGPVIHKALDELAHAYRVVRAEGKVKLPFRPGVTAREERQLELSGD